MNPRNVSSVVLDRLRSLDTCTASNAIERLNVRLRNEGFISHAVHCQFPQFAPMVGYAVTGRVRASAPPMAGRSYFDRMDWWSHLASLPEPRVMVLQDVDEIPGVGALVGEIHATIAQALNCIGCVTNGAVRDLSAVEALGFHLFAGNVSVTHAYAHIVEFGTPVEIGGLKINPGDLVHGDRNGIHLIPLEVAAEVPEVAQEVMREEGELMQFCRSRDFSLQELAGRMKIASENEERQPVSRTQHD